MDKMTQEPCDFVKLVLSRMDSNPDEFEHYGRWSTLCAALERYAGGDDPRKPLSDRTVLWAYDQFEIDLMLAKYREIYRDREYKSMLKNLLVGQETKVEGLIKTSSPFVTQPGTSLRGAAPYQPISPQQLFANGPTTTSTLAGAGGHIGATLGSGLQYADNTATGTGIGLNPQLRSQIDDAIEARLQGFKRG